MPLPQDAPRASDILVFEDDFLEMDGGAGADNSDVVKGCGCFPSSSITRRTKRSSTVTKGSKSRSITLSKRLMSSKSINMTTKEEQMNIHDKVRDKRAKERKKIITAPLEAVKSFKPPQFPKSESEMEFIRKALLDNFIFSSLSKNNINTLIGSMERWDCSSDTTIIEQGDTTSDFFYIVSEGVVSFVVDGTNVGRCRSGGSFGELALLYNSARAASCISEEDCTLFKLDQHTFRYVVALTTSTDNEDLKEMMKEIGFFSQLDRKKTSQVSDLFTTLTFNEGDTLFRKDDPGDVLYIVNKGSVVLSDIGSGNSSWADHTLKQGDCFGELALLTKGGKRSGTATANEPNTELFCLSRFAFEEAFGDPLEVLIASQKRNVIDSVRFLVSADLTPRERRQLMDLFKRESFPKGQVLVKSGEPCLQAIYFIHSGKVVVNQDDGVMKSLATGDFLGSTFMERSPDTVSTETVVMEEDTVLFTLFKSDINSVIDSDRIKKGPPKHRKNEIKAIPLKSLEKLKILGQGTFGTVWLVQHKQTRKAFALKLCSKRSIMSFGQVKGIIREKHVLTSIDHPFIYTLVCTYQDRYNLLFLFDLVQGGELYNLIIAQGRLPNSHAVFYSACLLEAFTHLHDHYICYRDLKPENVLIDAKGYCQLADMGFAKFVLDKTFTFCGTPEYIAPEIIQSKGHDQQVDCWSFGILVYEMLVGVSPFYDEGRMDQTSLFKRIVKAKYKTPSIVNDFAKDLIDHLLILNPQERYGFFRDDRIRAHDWFVGENKDYLSDVLEQKVLAPWVPDIKDATDGSNFDDFSDLENTRQDHFHLSNDEQMLFKDF